MSSQVEFLWGRRLCLYLVSQLKLVTCVLPAFFFTYRNSMRADSISTSNIKNRIGNKLLPEKFADVRHLLDEKRQHSGPRPAVGSTKPGTILLSLCSVFLLVSPPVASQAWPPNYCNSCNGQFPASWDAGGQAPPYKGKKPQDWATESHQFQATLESSIPTRNSLLSLPPAQFFAASLPSRDSHPLMTFQ